MTKLSGRHSVLQTMLLPNDKMLNAFKIGYFLKNKSVSFDACVTIIMIFIRLLNLLQQKFC
jgi:hypothetical protein